MAFEGMREQDIRADSEMARGQREALLLAIHQFSPDAARLLTLVDDRTISQQEFMQRIKAYNDAHKDLPPPEGPFEIHTETGIEGRGIVARVYKADGRVVLNPSVVETKH